MTNISLGFGRIAFKFGTLIAFLAILAGTPVQAAEEGSESSFVMHHIKDSYDWHLIDINHHPVSVPLPVILYNKGTGFDVFMSSAFHHDNAGKVPVEAGKNTYLKYHEKIYLANADGDLTFDDAGHPTNARPMLDLSITKNVFFSIITAIIVLWVFLSVASKYKKYGVAAPSGVQSLLEPVILFVRDDIAIPNIGKQKHERFMPYLLSVFFFIWFANLLGLFPGAANLTGNIAVTFTFAFITFLITNFSGNKHYWNHIFNTPGVPWWLKFGIPIMPIVEFIGIFTKPFSLMVRLFANITAGHIIILSIIGLIFIFKSAVIGVVSVPFAAAMTFLELLVAFIQAYVFTLLSAIYIGGAVEEAHDH
ncbi:MAG TPA: ATP synthase F0 subunit A [Cytophagales bacterium]|jgi:F-type H+-transporting ATPase subunit a|nr:ATP synthase F0 subunit A [Cytophagales bacterium]